LIWDFRLGNVGLERTPPWPPLAEARVYT